MQTIFVSTHAIARWRERVALYGDAPVSEIQDALRAATPVGDHDPLPFARQAHTRYFRHATRSDVYFVCEPLDLGVVRVVTVVQWIEQPPHVASLVHTEKYIQVPSPQRIVEPSFADVSERYEWYLALLHDAEAMFKQVPKGHPQRGEWRERYLELGRCIGALGPLHRELKKERQRQAEEIKRAAERQEKAERGEGIYLADGRINMSVAVRFLLLEVERLKAEVEQWKAERLIEQSSELKVA